LVCGSVVLNLLQIIARPSRWLRWAGGTVAQFKNSAAESPSHALAPATVHQFFWASA
jgi:hypothetical protein